MPTEATIRKRRNRQDAYLDLDDNPLDENGLLKDGRSYRSSMMMADFGAFIIDSHAVPPRSSFVYKRGYLSDQRGHIVDQRVRKPPMPTGTEPELSRGAPWPTANSGLYSYWQQSQRSQ